MKITLIILLSLGLFAGLAAMMSFHKPMWLFYHGELKTADKIISRVDAFQMKQNRLPRTLQEVGYPTLDESVFYVNLSNDEYCLWFGTELGQSETYRSHSKKWEEGRQCVP